METIKWLSGQLLNQTVRIYVPSTVNVDSQLSDEKVEEFVQRTARFLSELFGGATAVEAKGFYVASSGHLVTEKVTIVYAYTTLWSRLRHGITVKRYCEALKRDMAQELVLYRINDTARFV